MSLDDEELCTWADFEKILLGDLIPSKKARKEMPYLLYTYRDVTATELCDIPATDQI
jgi:hypothetical protein